MFFLGSDKLHGFLLTLKLFVNGHFLSSLTLLKISDGLDL